MRVHLCETCNEAEPVVWWLEDDADTVLCLDCWAMFEEHCGDKPVDVVAYVEVACE